MPSLEYFIIINWHGSAVALCRSADCFLLADDIPKTKLLKQIIMSVDVEF